MESNVFPISENTTVIVRSSGDLYLRGEGKGELRFQSSEDRIRVNQSNNNVYVETHASLDLEVPRETNVIVEKVGGSALLQDLNGTLTVQKVGGDLGIQRMVKVTIEKVGGTCLIDSVSESLSVGKVGADLTVRQALGRVQVGTVGGSCDLQVLGGDDLEVRSGADTRLYITDGMSGKISLRAGSSIKIYIPSNANGRLSLNSSGENIELRLTHQDKATPEEINARRYELKLGTGGAQIEATAGADILVSDEEVEPESISIELERREVAWKEARERRGGPSWSAGFGFDRTSAWAEMVSRRAQEAAQRAEQRAQRAVRRTEEQIRMAAERQIRQAVESDFTGPGHPFSHIPHPEPPPVSRSEPVSEQERMVVLQLLSEKKITVEQAEKLLAALEGRF
jgi:hypothetical protein